ncbi:unnamed protein product [Darwinula stevensoni]|uniref:DUF7869 domain-containing protein n=1 Tax=Darwinula stevensoni TaxID=69355 RepID=A0A7R9AE89_9CRUS|nr:unnamed protein product [Darwinula stevensoni]CAG0902100.1 unnamed protein product [Darwinula stevensoni]
MRVQRSNYADHKVMGLRNDDWLTMVIDGMDQTKTNIPRFSKEDKHTTSLPKIITHITGVMVYTGKGIREFAFVDMGQFPHDSNLCVEVILRSLLHVKMDLKNKLFLQMCSGELEQHFKGHSLPLGFRFRKIHGVTQLHVRKHAMANWCPNEEDNQYDREALGPDLGYLVLKEATPYIWTLVEHKRTLTTPGMTPTMLNFLRGMENQLLRPLEQPIIGSVGSRRQGAFSGTEDLQLGMLAAVFTYDEVSRPWLGKAQAIEDGDTVRIRWYMGGYPKSWKPMSGTNSTSSVHCESLLLWGFTLTEKSQRLTSETAAELKRLYQETEDRMTIQQDRISEEV